MGGCRCSYRKCTLRSDGITHMFHYPVFDKVRCHKWLTNAHKLEFLNLKVSQLKNRVICQHHFTDECFMNFKKDKLTFDAIPTIDGPYCDSTQNDVKNSDILKMYPIILDDIENEYLTLTDKQANFSIKYGDFLTNGEMVDFDHLDIINNKTEVVSNNDLNYKMQSNHNMMDLNSINVISRKTEDISKNNLNHKVQADPVQSTNILELDKFKNDPIAMDIKTLYEYSSCDPTFLGIEVEVPPALKTNQTEENSNDFVKSSQLNNTNKNNFKNIKEGKIKILSEKKVTKPLKFEGTFKPLSPSSIIKPLDKKIEANTKEVVLNTLNNNKEMISIKPMKNITLLMHPTEELAAISNKTLQETDDQNDEKKLLNTTINNKSSSKTMLKNKVSPIRVAAIREKRKFNMKLRDIIETCLDQNKSDINIEVNSKVHQDVNKNVGNFLSEEQTLPSLSEYTIASLEGRIKKMENLLLNKIDQNSQRIVELKNSIHSTDKKSKCIQTVRNEESHKRNLYKEISQYLSPELNSLIYEELFLNKFVQKAVKSSPLNKRRRKR